MHGLARSEPGEADGPARHLGDFTARFRESELHMNVLHEIDAYVERQRCVQCPALPCPLLY
jgi:hypothetical protein